MDETDRGAFENDVRALCQKGDRDGAATLALRGYGGEVFGFLVAMHRDETAASDAFSSFAEGLWKGLPAFEWTSTLRTWAYSIARNVTRTARRDARRRDWHGGRRGESALEDVAQAVRTSTMGFLRTDKRGRLEALRDALSPEDRALLILRLDRGLEWTELARVMSEAEGPISEEEALKREAARLRKRFQVVKDRLRELAKREGLRD